MLRILPITKETLLPHIVGRQVRTSLIKRETSLLIHVILHQCCKTNCTFFVPSLLSFRAKQGIFQEKGTSGFHPSPSLISFPESN